MAWIYLAESAESPLPSETTCDPLHTAKLIVTAKEYCCPDNPLEIWSVLQYGMIYGHSPVLFSEKQSTSFMAASHARTLAVQDAEQAWKESEAGYFSRSFAWPKKSSPSSYFLKTYQLLQAEGDFAWLEKLPKWGMIVDGVLYPLQALEHYIDGKDGSYWLTPSTMEHLPIREGEALENALHRGKNRDSRRKVSGRLNEQVAYPMMWPTPCLASHVMMATPTASQANKPIRDESRT